MNAFAIASIIVGITIICCIAFFLYELHILINFVLTEAPSLVVDAIIEEAAKDPEKFTKIIIDRALNINDDPIDY